MKKNFLPIGIVVLGIMIGFGILLAQGAVGGFGFEKNTDERKSADAESVAGCVQSCKDMVAGWQEMNPESPNYTRQQKKITAKAEQCLTMNELAGSPYNEEEILQSCGLEFEGPGCTTNADCDDGNPCTVESCVTGGRFEGCLRGNVVTLPGEEPISCHIDGQLGVCVEGTCQPTEPECVEVSQEDADALGGACADLSSLPELLVLPQCCAVEAPRGVDCGLYEEWVVGVTAFPVCYIPGS